MIQTEVQTHPADGTSTWGTIHVGEGRLQVRHVLLGLGAVLWLLPLFVATSVHGIAWFAFNVSTLLVLICVSSTVRTVSLHKLAICFLGGGLLTGLTLATEQSVLTAIGQVFPLRQMITVPLEELAKLAVVFFMLWRGRNFSTWTLGATDVLLMGAAAGAGFAVVEDSFRHFMQPAALSNLSVIMPASEFINGRIICGQAVWAGLAAGTLGLALLFRHRQQLALPLAAAGFLIACLDHLALDYSSYTSAFAPLQNILNGLALNGYLALGAYAIVVAAAIGTDSLVTFGNLPRTKEFSLPRRKDRREHFSSLWDCVLDLRRLNYAYFRYRHRDDQNMPASLAIAVALLAKRLVNRYLNVEPVASKTHHTAGDGDTLTAMTASQALKGRPAPASAPMGGGISPFDRRPLQELIDLPEQYELKEEAARGGMGIVFKATHRETQANLAVKIVHPHLTEDPNCIMRFEQEAKATSQLKHPNIVTVFDYGVTPKQIAYIVMEWLDGTSLERTVKLSGPLSAQRFTHIFIQASSALSHAHRKGIVHRDVKPSNIILTRTNEGPDVVKVVDFGIAKVLRLDQSSKMELTDTGELLGSPYFMSPEQCSGTGVDNRSDIYSLGCVMYEALCGAPPFSGNNPAQMIFKHLNEMPKQPRTINPDIVRPELYEPMLFRCLQKDPDKRYLGMAELEQELKGIAETLKNS